MCWVPSFFVGKPVLHARQVGGDRGVEEDHQVSQGDHQDPGARRQKAIGGARWASRGKANLIHDLLEVKDAKDKLEMDVNHLESEASELFAMNITNIISDVQKEEKLRKIEDVIRS